jgi:hypothetical protein
MRRGETASHDSRRDDRQDPEASLSRQRHSITNLYDRHLRGRQLVVASQTAEMRYGALVAGWGSSRSLSSSGASLSPELQMIRLQFARATWARKAMCNYTA